MFNAAHKCLSIGNIGKWPSSSVYSGSSILRPPMGPRKCGLILQVVLKYRSFNTENCPLGLNQMVLKQRVVKYRDYCIHISCHLLISVCHITLQYRCWQKWSPNTVIIAMNFGHIWMGALHCATYM